MMEVQEEEAPIVTDTRGQDRPGGREGRQHIPRSEEDQDPGPGPRHGGGRGPRGQCRDRDRRVKIRILPNLRI